MKTAYENYISFGYFCEVALDLEKLGLRSFSSPFDWVYSFLPDMIHSIDNGFEGFMEYDHLSQDCVVRKLYLEEKHQIVFYHDFSAYVPLSEQYEAVKEKYWRRIDRFFEKIQQPTLFVRYITSEYPDPDGRPHDLNWAEENYDYMMKVLRRFNPENDIVLLGDETVHSDLLKIYSVPKDPGDTVSRAPIFNNKELFPIMAAMEKAGKEENQRIAAIKDRKRKSVITKAEKRLNRDLSKLFRKEYVHERTFMEPRRSAWSTTASQGCK